MTLKIFAVFDNKAAAFMQPFFAPTVGFAIRAFADQLKNDQSAIKQHPEDYTLFHLGDFDDHSGGIVRAEPKATHVANAIDFVEGS